MRRTSHPGRERKIKPLPVFPLDFCLETHRTSPPQADGVFKNQNQPQEGQDGEAPRPPVMITKRRALRFFSRARDCHVEKIRQVLTP